MKGSSRALLYSILLLLTLSILTPSEITHAEAACKGLIPLTDPLAIRMEHGETVIWDHVNPNLLSAKAKYEQLLQEKGWTIHYSSAYRPYQYQKHLYEIATGPSSVCKNLEKKKHGLAALVSKPDLNAPHTKGIAFDATIYDEHSKALNGIHFVSASLIKLANQAGLKFINTHKDGVHHQIMVLAPKQPPAPTETTFLAKGIVVNASGLDVKASHNLTALKIGSISKNAQIDITAKSVDWYKIKFGRTYGWILGTNGSVKITNISSIKVPYYVNLLSKPNFTSKNFGKIAPQTVYFIKNNGNGWYQISSSIGAAWIFVNPKPLKELKTNKKVTLYNQPWTTSKANGQIAPQKVKILIDRGDGWYQISTWLGAKWILVR